MADITENTLAIGTIIKGDYEYKIDQVLGQGGYGITYHATAKVMVGNIPHVMPFTIKEFFMQSCCGRAEDGSVISCGDQSELKACITDFVHEAEHLKKLKHPGIVAVNEIIKANNTFYYVMTYLAGISLRALLRERTKLDEALAVRLTTSVGEALKTLHKEKMTHLDVKPGNIMLVSEGEGEYRPVLIDFGLSKHYNLLGSATSKAGGFGVSDGFSPIEQYSGIREFSPTADVYALAATLFNCVTGVLPKTAADVTESYLTQQLGGVSENVRKAIIKGMKFQKSERCQTIDEFLDILNDGAKPAGANESMTVSIKPAQKSINVAGILKKAGIGVAACALLLGGGYGISQLISGGGGGADDNLPGDSVEVKSDTTIDIQNSDSIKVNQEASGMSNSGTSGSGTSGSSTSGSGISGSGTNNANQRQGQSGTNNQQSSQQKTPAPQPTQGKVTLTKIHATFEGTLLNGKPQPGRATITFTEDCEINDVQYSAGETLSGVLQKDGRTFQKGSKTFIIQ